MSVYAVYYIYNVCIKYICIFVYEYILYICIDSHMCMCVLYIKREGGKEFIRVAYRLWSNQSNNGCLPIESPRSQHLFSLQGQMSKLVFSIHWDPKEVGSIANGQIDLPGRARICRVRPKPSFFRLPAKGMAQI